MSLIPVGQPLASSASTHGAPTLSTVKPARVLLSVPEAAAWLGVGRTQMFALLKDKSVARVKLGAKTLVPMDSLKAFADQLIAEQSGMTEE